MMPQRLQQQQATPSRPTTTTGIPTLRRRQLQQLAAVAPALALPAWVVARLAEAQLLGWQAVVQGLPSRYWAVAAASTHRWRLAPYCPGAGG